jgi:hypothetical protein
LRLRCRPILDGTATAFALTALFPNAALDHERFEHDLRKGNADDRSR